MKIGKIVKKRIYEHFDDFARNRQKVSFSEHFDDFVGFRQNRQKASFCEHFDVLAKTAVKQPQLVAR